MGQSKVEIQSAQKRITNFHEVSLGYSKKIAVDESRRCPQCADPVCLRGCPLGIAIPSFIRMLREGNVAGAYDKIKEKNFLPAICGRICSAPCEAACVLTDENAPIGIRALERYSVDNGRTRATKNKISPNNKKVAIIGSGPAGLTAAYFLALKGFSVKIFEAMDKPGGVLRYGIPEFRIPKKVLDQEVQDLRSMGVEIEINCFIGKTITLDDISQQGFLAVLVATGAGMPKFVDLPGTNLGGVYYGEEFLMRVNLTKGNFFSGPTPNFVLGPRVLVVGSGNTALDCARAALRFGRDVTLVFRRTEDEMRVRFEERNFAKEEGLKIEPLARPTELLGNGNNFVRGLQCVRLDYAESVEQKKWVLTEVPDSSFLLEADTVILAIGHRPNVLLGVDFKYDEDGTLSVDADTGLTAIPKIFACGNVVTNAGPVVEAIASGQHAAEKIAEFLK